MIMSYVGFILDFHVNDFFIFYFFNINISAIVSISCYKINVKHNKTKKHGKCRKTVRS